MNKRTISKRLLAIHSAISVVFLLLISWAIFTGILSIYADLVRPWLRQDVAAAYAAAPPTPGEVLAFVHEGRDPGPKWNLVAPTPVRPFYIYSGPLPGGGKPTNLMVQPATGLKDPWNNGLADGLFRRIHTDLLLPKPFGRFLMGLTGALIVILVGTGVFIHGKQLREAWLWRRRSRLLDLSESHKRVGLWITPFLLLLALTGAILGLKIVVAPLATMMGGGKAAILSADPSARTKPAPTVSVAAVDGCVERFSRILPDVRFAGAQRTEDNLVLRGVRDKTLQWAGEGGGSVLANCALATGELRLVQTAPAGGVMGAVESGLRPIHYARFGGYGTLVIYIALSVLCMWVIDSGMKLYWFRIRREDGAPSASQRIYQANNTLYVLLPIVLLYGNLLAGKTPWLVMGVLTAAVVLAHFTRFHGLLSGVKALAAAGVLYISLPICRETVLGWSLPQSPLPVWLTSFSLLAFGAYLLATCSQQLEKAKLWYETGLLTGDGDPPAQLEEAGEKLN
jgi:uncharacterized iron-regulated membrane protein